MHVERNMYYKCVIIDRNRIEKFSHVSVSIANFLLVNLSLKVPKTVCRLQSRMHGPRHGNRDNNSLKAGYRGTAINY